MNVVSYVYLQIITSSFHLSLKDYLGGLKYYQLVNEETSSGTKDQPSI